MDLAEREHLLKGIDLFNEGKYYECHDVMEYLWGHGTNELRDLYKGILHLAVALYHFRNHNLKGTESLLGSGVKLLEHYVPFSEGIDIFLLVSDAKAFLQQIPRGEPGACRIFTITLREVAK